MCFRIVLPTIYALGAGLAWIDFAGLPPDGLANLGLMLAVLPVALIELALRSLLGSSASLLIPSQLGYYSAHAVFFASGVAVVATALFLLGRWIDRRRARAADTARF